MSFRKLKTFVEEGDVVILYFGVDSILKLEVTEERKSKNGTKIVENVLQTKFGVIRPYSLLGKKYGSKIQLTKGWGIILQPTTDLWTITLPHRTQIIYGPDISLILTYLELKPGSIIVEAGTGSGSLSHAFINTIKPSGKLYTFDYHEERVKVANEEFSQHGLSDWVIAKQADVYTDGFPGVSDNSIDAVFLDLPKPWLALPFSTKILKNTGGRICCFSPCIEQVQHSVLCLTQLGFRSINTTEFLQTTYNVYERQYPLLDLNVLKTPNDETGESTTTMEEENLRKMDKLRTATRDLLVNCPMPETQAGHTGYLTTATYYGEFRQELQNLNISNNFNEKDTVDDRPTPEKN